MTVKEMFREKAEEKYIDCITRCGKIDEAEKSYIEALATAKKLTLEEFKLLCVGVSFKELIVCEDVGDYLGLGNKAKYLHEYEGLGYTRYYEIKKTLIKQFSKI